MEEIDKINDFIDKNTVVISINHSYEMIKIDYIFLSNLRRFRELEEVDKNKCIVTSNISVEGVYYQAKYKALLNAEEAVSDNAGLMAIRFLMDFDVEGIYLVGFDGYSHDVRENYGNSELAFISRNAVLDAINKGMSKVLSEYGQKVKIRFVTLPKHVILEGNLL